MPNSITVQVDYDPHITQVPSESLPVYQTGRHAQKTRNWAFILYPESAPANWMNMLADTHIEMFISPLHDKDVDENGELKKPHYHIVFTKDGPITQGQANKIIAPFHGTKSAEYVQSRKGYVRYLAHLDDLDKAQYDPREIIALGGADITKMVAPSEGVRYELIGEIFDFCKQRPIVEFSALSDYARRERFDDWFPIIINNSPTINRYLTSLRHAGKNPVRDAINSARRN